MAQKCRICGKGRQIGHNVSYSKRRTRRVFLPNLRWARLSLGGEVKRVKICMKCLKKAKKEGRVVTRVPRESRVPRVPREEVSQVETKQEAKPKKRGRPKKLAEVVPRTEEVEPIKPELKVVGRKKE